MAFLLFLSGAWRACKRDMYDGKAFAWKALFDLTIMGGNET